MAVGTRHCVDVRMVIWPFFIAHAYDSQGKEVLNRLGSARGSLIEFNDRGISDAAFTAAWLEGVKGTVHVANTQD